MQRPGKTYEELERDVESLEGQLATAREQLAVKPPDRSELVKVLEETKTQLQKTLNERDQLTQIVRQRDKTIEGNKSEIIFLKEELHSLTIVNARLEGYRERVEKFDPVTEQQEYEAHRQRFVRHGIADSYGVGAATGRDRPVSWYRRG